MKIKIITRFSVDRKGIYMNILKIRELGEGNSQTYLLVKDITGKTARNGKPYVLVTMTDGKDSISANMWDMSAPEFPVSAGEVVFVTLRVAPYNGKTSYTIERARALNISDPVSPADFVKGAPVAPDELFDRCMEIVSRYMSDEELIKLTRTVFAENRIALLRASAAKSVHHNGVGELLWHVYRMALVAPRIADVYKLNRDLLVAGALLHDIGKLRELTTDSMGITSYTLDGNLFGHLMLGAEMIEEYGRQCEISPDKIRALKHIIASHHGSLEFGAISQPAIPEAYAVYILDTLDSRLYIYSNELDKLEEGAVSDRIHFLDGASVWKSGL